MPITEKKNNSGISSREQEAARTKNAPSKDAKSTKKAIVKQKKKRKLPFQAK